ncbi:MAG: acyl-CoA dehydrogenase, partial [Gammaproteobacteria bacterium]|nr:acyl-CoA dehydrogenase [Gammaproteobacteria bacterium]
MTGFMTALLYLGGALLLAYRGARVRTAAIASAVLLLVYLIFGSGSVAWTAILLITAALLTVLSLDEFRRHRITRPLFSWYRRVLPPISETEREAIAAGTVWWDGELFSGRPDWNKLLNSGRPALTDEEKAFLDGPVEELCRKVDAWKLAHQWADIPPEILEFIKQHKFLGLIIPKEYGGLDLSA